MRQFTTLFMVMACLIANAQLSGTYSVNNFYPTKIKKKNFSSITDAINAIEEEGLKGDVEFVIEKGKYYEPMIFENINTDGEYQVTFKAEEDEKVSFINDALALYIENSKNIAFDNITFYSKSCQYSSIVELESASNISFENCDISSKTVQLSDRALVSLSKSDNNRFEYNDFFGYNCFYIEEESNNCFFQGNDLTAFNVAFFVSNTQNTIIHLNQMEKSNTAIAIDEQAENLVITDNNIQAVTRALTQVPTDSKGYNKYEFSGEMACNTVTSEKDAVKLLNNTADFEIGENNMQIGIETFNASNTPTEEENQIVASSIGF